VWPMSGWPVKLFSHPPRAAQRVAANVSAVTQLRALLVRVNYDEVLPLQSGRVAIAIEFRSEA
jgi:hypothetical protein